MNQKTLDRYGSKAVDMIAYCAPDGVSEDLLLEGLSEQGKRERLSELKTLCLGGFLKCKTINEHNIYFL